MRKTMTALVALSLLAAPAFAAEKAKEKAPKKPKAEIAAEKAVMKVTHHKLNTLSGPVSYVAEAGETEMKGEDGKPIASIFSVSYLREDQGGNRPVMFIFNGGPGSASLWLHLGLYGPKRVVLPSDGENPGAPPYRMVDNEYSLIDMADLVFIDPVGTGYSRPLGDKEGKDFWGVKEDAKSVGDFIRLWLNKHKRWNSPKYLSGESYGTTRSAAVAYELGADYNAVALNGVVLISSILDFTGARFQPGNEIAYLSYLPTYAATAWYHNKVPHTGTVAQQVQAARDFAGGDYALALLKGNRLSADARAKVRDRLAELTGLSPVFIENADLRIRPDMFQKELLRDQGLTVGRLDGRYKGKDYDNAGESPEDDPSGYGIAGPYTAAINQYLQADLGFETERAYEVLSGKVNQSWSWKLSDRGGWPGFTNVAPMLGEVMRKNAGLDVLVANGYYDMATPVYATENSFATNGIPGGNRVTFTYYEAGHMMYVHQPSLVKLAKDVRDFVAKTK